MGLLERWRRWWDVAEAANPADDYATRVEPSWAPPAPSSGAVEPPPPVDTAPPEPPAPESEYVPWTDGLLS